jgi:hypothetical protein
MNEARVRERLREALGDSSYPRDLSSRAAARLGQAPEQWQPTGWALAIATAVLAVAVVATIAF